MPKSRVEAFSDAVIAIIMTIMVLELSIPKEPDWVALCLLVPKFLTQGPFVTGWMGENNFASVPTAAYGVVLLLSAIAYYILQTVILASHDPDFRLRAALGKDIKGKISPVLYVAGIPLAFVNRWGAVGIYVFVALMWLVPDRRIESMVVND